MARLSTASACKSRLPAVDGRPAKGHNKSMVRTRQVAVIVDSTMAYHRKVLLGVAAYVHEVGNWSLYIEDEPLEKLPVPGSWRGDGMLITFVNRHMLKIAVGFGVPMVGIEGGLGWYDPSLRIPYFATDNAAIGGSARSI